MNRTKGNNKKKSLDPTAIAVWEFSAARHCCVMVYHWNKKKYIDNIEHFMMLIIIIGKNVQINSGKMLHVLKTIRKFNALINANKMTNINFRPRKRNLKTKEKSKVLE